MARAGRILAVFLASLFATPAVAAFVTFESGQVRPLALSPDGTHLFAVNTPDDRLEIFDVGAGGLTHAGSVPVGLEPVAVAARNDGEVWVVNHLSDSVSVVDVASVPPRVVRTLLVGDEPRDVVFAGPGRDRAFVTTAHRGQSRPGDPQLTTPGIGRADVWVFDAAALGSSVGGTPLAILTLFTDTPRALAVSPDGGTVYAAGFETGNQTTTISEGAVCDGGPGAQPCTLSDNTQSPGGLPGPTTNVQGTPRPETGLIVRFDGASAEWHDGLGRSWNPVVRFTLPDEDVFAIDANATPPVQTAFFTGVGTILFDMVVNPANGNVYVSNTDARNEVRFEGPGIFGGSTVRGHLHEARITVLDGTGVHPRHLNKHIDYGTVPSLPGTSDASLATPVGMAITADGSTLYVAAFGSSAIGMFDTGALEDDSFVPSSLDHIPVTGGGPSGLVLDEPHGRLYVLTRFDDAISVVDTSNRTEVAHLPLHDPEPASVRVGRPFLYDAVATSSNGEASCSSCHVFGDFDSLAWDLGNPDDVVADNNNPFVQIPLLPVPSNPKFHPMKGPMTTQTLRGMVDDGPMHWRGDRTVANDPPPNDNPLTNPAGDFEKFNVAFVGLLGRSGYCSVTTGQSCQSGAGCPAGESCFGLSDADMQAFADFILQVTLPPNPIRTLDGSFTADQQAGHDLFLGRNTDTVTNCNGCHGLEPQNGFFGTRGMMTIEGEPQEFKVPHLRNLYQKVGMFGMAPVSFFTNGGGNNTFTGPQVRGFGFLHDGSVDTLFRFHHANAFSINDIEAAQLEQFVLAFDSNLAPIVGQQITLTDTNAAVVASRISLLLARAAVGECEVVAKGVVAGEDRGWLLGAGGFRSDRAAEPLLSDPQLRAQAATPGQELTYTAVPTGSGVRVGIDRDEDGFLDRDELDAGSDPADASSIPPGATTTTTTTSTTTTTIVPPSGKSKCAAKKLVLAGKEGSGRMRCHTKAIAAGTPTPQSCLDETRAHSATKWAKLEKPNDDCLTHGDLAAVLNSVDSSVDAFVQAFAVVRPNVCEVTKLSAVGTRLLADMKCQGKAARKDIPVDPNCTGKALARFNFTYSSAEGSGNDCPFIGEITIVNSALTGLENGLVNQLVP